MHARVLHTPDIPIVEAFLRKHADSSMILLGNLATDGIEDDGKRFSGTWAGAFDGQGELRGVAAHFRVFNNVFPQAENEAALEAAVACAVATSGQPVRGLIGLRTLVRRAQAQLGMNDAPWRYEAQEGLFALDLARLRLPELLSDPDVELRALRAEDRDTFVRWSLDYERGTLGDTDGPELRARCEQSFANTLQRGERCLLTHTGLPRAKTDFNARLPDMVQIGGVYTPPEARSRGYARAAVAASLRDARERGVKRAILFTRDDNRAAVNAYTAIGFERIDDFALLLL
jgi:GNAT superfamily N-acetyltransferase